jgi:hypothetical protein
MRTNLSKEDKIKTVCFLTNKLETQWEIVEDDGKDWAVGSYLLRMLFPLGMRSKHDDCHYMFNAVSEKMVGMAMTSQKTISEIPESQLALERLAYVVVV